MLEKYVSSKQPLIHINKDGSSHSRCSRLSISKWEAGDRFILIIESTNISQVQFPLIKFFRHLRIIYESIGIWSISLKVYIKDLLRTRAFTQL